VTVLYLRSKKVPEVSDVEDQVILCLVGCGDSKRAGAEGFFQNFLVATLNGDKWKCIRGVTLLRLVKNV
jgi:hypothetical protein